MPRIPVEAKVQNNPVGRLLAEAAAKPEVRAGVRTVA